MESSSEAGAHLSRRLHFRAAVKPNEVVKTGCHFSCLLSDEITDGCTLGAMAVLIVDVCEH